MPVNMNLAALYMNENGEYKPIPGVRGEPGVTPTISVEDIPGGHRVTIAGAEGSTSIDVMDGTNGVSPTVAVTDVTGGHRVTITDAIGTRSFDVMDGAHGSDGAPGAAGVSPTVAVTDITGGHRVTITDAIGTRSFDVMDGATGAPGAPGAAGVSPTVAVTNITGGHRVTITDATGSSSFDVMDGATGAPGAPGVAGVSPTVAVTDVTGGHRVTITDATGTRSFDVMDGVAGSDGAPGAAGVSPTVAVTNITGGHRVTITDATGSSSFDVMDGANGSDGTPGATGPAGPGVPAGGTAGQVLKKSSATDYVTEWADESGGSMFITFTGSSSSTSCTADKTFAEVYAAYQSGTPIFASFPSQGEIYSLKSASAARIILSYVQVFDGGGSVRESKITFYPNESASRSWNGAVIPSVPDVLNANPIIDVELDNTVNPPRYYVAGSDVDDVIEITKLNHKTLVTLNYVKDSYDGAPGDGREESFEQYHLSDVQSVTTYDEDEGTYIMKFHLVFTNVEVSSSGAKIKKFELVDDAFTYNELLDATVTYSETALAVAP